jgi:hypothetical protein
MFSRWINVVLRDIKLSPRCKWNLRTSGMLLRLDLVVKSWIFCGPLYHWTDKLSRNVGNKHQSALRNIKVERRSHVKLLLWKQTSGTRIKPRTSRLRIHQIRRAYILCTRRDKKVKVKWSRYRSGVAQKVGRGIALLFPDRGTRRGWVVSSTPRPHFIPGKDPVPILQEAECAPGPVRTGGKSRPHRDSIPDRPARTSFAIPTELPGPRTRSGVTLILFYVRLFFCNFVA